MNLKELSLIKHQIQFSNVIFRNTKKSNGIKLLYDFESTNKIYGNRYGIKTM